MTGEGLVLGYPFRVTLVRAEIRVTWQWAADVTQPDVQSLHNLIRDPGRYVEEHLGRFPVELVDQAGNRAHYGASGTVPGHEGLEGSFVFVPREGEIVKLSPGPLSLQIVSDTVALH